MNDYASAAQKEVHADDEQLQNKQLHLRVISALPRTSHATTGTFADDEGERPAGIVAPLHRNAASAWTRIGYQCQSIERMRPKEASAPKLLRNILITLQTEALKEMASRGFASCWLR